jgi:putative Holliday junction resolvase
MPDADITVLGFDFGTKKIGIAIGNTLTGTARPLAILPTRDGAPDWDGIARLIAEWKPARLLVGLPLNMDGSDGEITVQARSFSRKLGGRMVLPVDLVDERLSSFDARGELRDAQHNNGKRKQPGVDAVAAALIIEQWLAQLPD